MTIETSVRRGRLISDASVSVVFIPIVLWLLWLPRPFEWDHRVAFFSLAVIFAVIDLYGLVEMFRLRVVVSAEGVATRGLHKRSIRFDDLKSVRFKQRSIELKSASGTTLILSKKLARFEDCRRVIYDVAASLPDVSIDGNPGILNQLKADTVRATVS